MIIHRRSLLVGLGAFLAAPAIVRVSSLMPVKSALVPEINWLTPAMITREAIKLFNERNAFIWRISEQYESDFGPPIRIQLPMELVQ